MPTERRLVSGNVRVFRCGDDGWQQVGDIEGAFPLESLSDDVCVEFLQGTLVTEVLASFDIDIADAVHGTLLPLPRMASQVRCGEMTFDVDISEAEPGWPSSPWISDDGYVSGYVAVDDGSDDWRWPDAHRVAAIADAELAAWAEFVASCGKPVR